jgi:predicted RNase H-like nuclease (RuvC/YqgF family)
MSSKQSVTKGEIVMNGTTTSNENAVKHDIAAAVNALAPSKDPMVSRAKQASTAWRSFEDAMKNMIHYSPIFSEMEAAMDRHSVMELETKTKDQRIAALEFSFQVQTEESGKLYMKWIEEKTQLEKKVAAVQNDANAHEKSLLKRQNAIHVQEMEQLKKELSAEKQKVDSLKNGFEKVTTGMQKTKDELNRCAGKLSEWEIYSSLLNDVDFKLL